MQYLTAGESHGPMLTGILTGMPANVALNISAINQQLALRQNGYGRGGRMKIEQDTVTITAGMRAGRTTGKPLSTAHQKPGLCPLAKNHGRNC